MSYGRPQMAYRAGKVSIRLNELLNFRLADIDIEGMAVTVWGEGVSSGRRLLPELQRVEMCREPI